MMRVATPTSSPGGQPRFLLLQIVVFMLAVIAPPGDTGERGSAVVTAFDPSAASLHVMRTTASMVRTCVLPAAFSLVAGPP